MRELVISEDQEKNKTYAILEDCILLEQYQERYDQHRMEGNIYLGEVENVLPGMQAAFVKIGEGRNTFIHLKDILPKLDVTKNGENTVQEKNIKDYLKKGKKILVQVKRDSTNKKGARVSSHISLNSRFYILMPNTDIITISQKIEEAKEKERLLNITKKIIPEGFGAIVRTASVGQKEEALKQDLEKAIKRWNQIEELAKQKEDLAPILIEENNNLVQRLLIDTIGNEESIVLTNKKEIYQDILAKVERLSLTKVEVNLKEGQDLLDRHELKKQLEKIDNRKIWLKCGGFITIDKTEALTAIDVNSGKYTGEKSLEETVLKVNKEATQEIAKQIRLRDIGGIIIIDYIDMHKKEHEQEVEELLKEELKKDRSKTQVLGFTKLNLLEMTRKHMFSND